MHQFATLTPPGANPVEGVIGDGHETVATVLVRIQDTVVDLSYLRSISQPRGKRLQQIA